MGTLIQRVSEPYLSVKNFISLQALEAETNTHINIPNRDSPSDVIKITGPREGMERAAAHIQRVASEQVREGG